MQIVGRNERNDSSETVPAAARRLRRFVLIGLLAATIATSGCAAAIEPAEVGETLTSDGPPTATLVLDAVTAVATELGVTSFDVQALTATSANATVAIIARDPASSDELDLYTVRRGELVSVEPVAVSDDADLDRSTFPIDTIALDRLDTIVDRAIEELDDGAHVPSVSVSTIDAEPRIVVRVVSPASSATAYFSASGELQEIAS